MIGVPVTAGRCDRDIEVVRVVDPEPLTDGAGYISSDAGKYVQFSLALLDITVGSTEPVEPFDDSLRIFNSENAKQPVQIQQSIWPLSNQFFEHFKGMGRIAGHPVVGPRQASGGLLGREFQQVAKGIIDADSVLQTDAQRCFHFKSAWVIWKAVGETAGPLTQYPGRRCPVDFGLV